MVTKVRLGISRGNAPLRALQAPYLFHVLRVRSWKERQTYTSLDSRDYPSRDDRSPSPRGARGDSPRRDRRRSVSPGARARDDRYVL